MPRYSLKTGGQRINRPSRNGAVQVLKDNQGRRISETEGPHITCCNRAALAIENPIRKGAKFMITGRTDYSCWIDSNGTKRNDFLSRAKHQEELALA